MKEKLANKKITLGLSTLAFILAVVIVSSFWPFILDPSRITTTEFITDTLINAAITISVTISMMFVSQAANAANPLSEIARSKVTFKESLATVTDHTSFYEWIKKKLQPRDRTDLAEKGMLRLGVPFSVWGLTDEETQTLTIPQEINGVQYKAITEKQIKAVIKLRRRVARTKFVDPSYYTTHRSFSSEKNLSQIAANENTKKILTVLFHLGAKMTAVFVGSAILGSLVRDLTQDGGSTAQAWMRFLSRMFAFCSSTYLGYLLGCKINDLDAFYILKRVEVHKLYNESMAKEADNG